MRWTPGRVRKFLVENGGYTWPEIKAGDTLSFRSAHWNVKSSGRAQRDLTQAEVVEFGSIGNSPIDTTPPMWWQTVLAGAATLLFFFGTPLLIILLTK